MRYSSPSLSIRNKIDFFISCSRVVTRLPGGKLYKDTRKEVRFEQRELSLPTTSRYPVWLFIGSVLIWHMYHPLSDSFTSRMWRNHVRWSLWETAIRWFFVITWLAIVNIVWVSTRSHATCNKIEKTLLVSVRISPLSSQFLITRYNTQSNRTITEIVSFRQFFGKEKRKDYLPSLDRNELAALSRCGLTTWKKVAGVKGKVNKSPCSRLRFGRRGKTRAREKERRDVVRVRMHHPPLPETATNESFSRWLAINQPVRKMWSARWKKKKG